LNELTTTIARARAALNAGEGQKALELARAALDAARSPDALAEQLAESLNLHGDVLLFRSEYAEAMSCFIEALDLWRQLDKSAMVVGCLHSIAQIDMHVGNLAEAAKACSAALTLAAGLDAATQAPLLQRMGMLYARLGDLERAQKFHEEAASYHRMIGDDAALASALNSIGTLYLRSGEENVKNDPVKARQAFLSARNQLETAAEIAKRTTDRHLQGLIAGNIGSVLARLGQLDDALELMHLQLEIVRSAGDRYNESLCLANIGEAMRLAGRPTDALEVVKDALTIAESLNSVMRQRRAHEELSYCFEELGDFRSALFHYKRFDHFKDAVHAEQTERQTHDLQIQVAVNEVRAQAESYRAERDRLEHLNARLHDEAYRDPLTQLSNRRSLDEGLEDAYSRSVRDKTPLAIALADVDHFKLINDRFSHATGDQVLRQISTLLRRALRDRDLVARYGGEEFALVLVGLELDRALMACERLRAAVQGYRWSEIHPDLQVTISIGVTAETSLGSGSAMLEAADHKLYEAKRAGRNRISH